MADEQKGEQNFDLSEFQEFSTEQPQDLEVTEHKDNFSIEYEQKETEVKPEAPKTEPKAEEPKAKDNPDSYAYWQSQADKRDRELREERDRRERLEREFEQMKAQINPPKKDEPLVRPQRPNTDDPLDLLKYNQELAEYQEKLINQKFTGIDQYLQSLEAERQARVQQEEHLKEVAFYVGQFVEAGADPNEAKEIYARYSQNKDRETYFKQLLAFDRFNRGQTNDPKAKEMEKRVTRQGELPPLGVIPSESETQNVDPSDAFFNDLKNSEKRYF